MFITEFHGEMNVVTFCYIAASIVLLQCYIPQSTKVWCSWLKKSKSLKLQLCWYKMMWQWHLMEHCIPAQLICHPQLNVLTWYFKTPPTGNGCGKHGAMKNSIYWPIMQYMRAWALLFPLQTDLIFQLRHIVATLAQDILIESPQKQRFCISYNEVQTFEWSSAVAQSTEFIQFAVNNVNTT